MKKIQSEKIKSLVSQLTLAEKSALISGTEFWKTNPIPRLKIPAIYLTDGPNGLRHQDDKKDNLGLNQSIPATCFPTGTALGSSWDPALLKKVGQSIGEECRIAGVNLLLGPAINIKKNPKCGRNFEYLAEDPLLTGKLASEYINGVQSQNVGAVVKHFAANNNENYRFMGNSVVDPRALNEIYLKAFEIVIKNSHPLGVMSAYNRLNGDFCSENRDLLQQILRDKWGFSGIVVSDWGGVDDRLRSLAAGCDLEMPGDCDYFRAEVIKAVQNGKLPQKMLDQAVQRLLSVILPLAEQSKIENNDWQRRHHQIAIEAASSGAVLLKNNGILPLTKTDQLVVVGDLFKKMRYQGAGSSLVNPTNLITPEQAFTQRKIAFKYLTGYHQFDQQPNECLEEAALTACEPNKPVLFFGGQTDLTESEVYDRTSLHLPANQSSLLQKLLDKGCQVILILFGGSAVIIPEMQKLAAILNMNLPGQGGGEATARLIFGEISPSGKLAETWLKSYQAIPFGKNYTRCRNELYQESIFVGYRYADTLPAEKVAFPFGYGLSYTQFDYQNFQIERKGNRIRASFEIKNVGQMAGAEVAQLYVSGPATTVFKPVKELRAFKKVYLQPDQKQMITFELTVAELAYYNYLQSSWVTENGDYHFYLAASSRDIKAEEKLLITDQPKIASPYDAELLADYEDPVSLETADFPEFARLFPNPPRLIPLEHGYTLNTRLDNLQHSFLGRIFYRTVIGVGQKQYQKALKMPLGQARDAALKNGMFLSKMLPNNSLRSMSVSSAGQFKFNLAQGLVSIFNHHYLKGIAQIIFSPRIPTLPKNKQ